MTVRLNRRGYEFASRLIALGSFVMDRSGDWSDHRPDSAQEDAFIRRHGMDVFAKWHLGEIDDRSANTKERFTFPFGDFAAVHRCALVTAKVRAGQDRHREIREAAASLLCLLGTADSRAELTSRSPGRTADVVEEASLESFPASDPPSWTPILGQRAAEPVPTGGQRNPKSCGDKRPE